MTGQYPVQLTKNIESESCEHIGLHFCIEAVFDTKFLIDDKLRVWYRRVDRDANDIQLSRK